MRHRPPDLSDEELRGAVAAHLSFGQLVDGEVEYVPIGAGSYHWRTSSFFITADDLTDKPFLGRDPETVFDRLRRALETARDLRRSGLEFVVAPIEGRGGDVLCRVGSRYALAVYPYLGESGPSGRTLSPDQRSAVTDMLKRLHAVPHSVAARARQVSAAVPLRDDLERALGSQDAPALLLEKGSMVREWLDRFDELVDRYSSDEAGLVVTHGEPHSRNVIRTEHGHMLVDWDTVGLAHPERDLWLVGGGRQELCELYRPRWRVDDLSSAVSILASRSGSDELRERARMVLRSSIEHEPLTED